MPRSLISLQISPMIMMPKLDGLCEYVSTAGGDDSIRQRGWPVHYSRQPFNTLPLVDL